MVRKLTQRDLSDSLQGVGERDARTVADGPAEVGGLHSTASSAKVGLNRRE